MNIITDQDAKDAGVKKEVYQDWANVMQALWTASIIFFRYIKENEDYLPSQKENQIFIGDKYTIDATMCNNAFVEARLWQGKEEKQLAKILYDSNVDTLCQCFFIIIKARM